MTDSTADTTRRGSGHASQAPAPAAGRATVGDTRILGVRIPFYYGWVILVVAATAAYVSAPGQTYTFSVFLGPIQSDLGLSSSVIASLYMGASMFAAFMVIIIGRLYDRFGPRVMLAVVGVLLGLAALWMSQVSDAIQLAIGFGALRTLGQGALSMIPATMVSVWFVRRRAKALALMMLGGALASGSFPAVANSLTEWLGWRDAWMAIAVIPWIMLVLPAALLVRRSPESIGLRPDGVTARGGRLAGYVDEESFTLREAMRQRALWLLMLAGTAQSAIGTGLMFHQVAIMGDRGIPSGVAAGLFGVTAPALLIGQFTSGFMADRYPIRLMVTFGQGLLFVAMAFLLTVSNTWQATVYVMILGFSTGFLMNSMLAIWPAYFGRAHLGSIKGVTQWAMMAAAAAGPLPLALSRDLTGSFTTGVYGLAVMPLVCGLAAFIARRPMKSPASAD